MDIYEYITMFLHHKGMTRKQLAEKTGINESTLNTMFARRSRIAPERLKKIAAALNLDVKNIIPMIIETDPMDPNDDSGRLLLLETFKDESIKNLCQRVPASLGINWLFCSSEFWELADRLMKMIEMGEKETWEYDSFQCHKFLAALLDAAYQYRDDEDAWNDKG